MAIKNLRGVVVNASNVPLLNHVVVKGYNTYTIGSNVLSWDGTNNYLLSHLANDFGVAVNNDPTMTMGLKCGDAAISLFDFSLLYSCFTSMTSAYAETGGPISTESAVTTAKEAMVVWFGNSCVFYNLKDNVVLPIRTSDVQNACAPARVQLTNFNDVRTFELTRENMDLVVSSTDGGKVYRFRIIDSVIRAYPQLFAVSDVAGGSQEQGDPNTPWDERSKLGSLVASSYRMSDAEETVQKYMDRSALGSVVVRSDLLCTPSKRYQSTEEFLGSICYTASHVIALAVNFRESLFIYRPWFNQKGNNNQVEINPKLQEFFNVTEECKHIMRYAATVTAKPPTVVQMDAALFEKIRVAFFNLELPRLGMASAFGKVVIPEPVLLGGIAAHTGENVQAIVPVGAIGFNIICRNSHGDLYTVTANSGDSGDQVADYGGSWGLGSAFYDITGVLK